ncbi:hypothetical protein GCM10010277_85430 [Streptomyces longisporoflavus]|nr:hypothetical protein GCM10010277_85430 [Streptomyces longisporoflavus]
MRQEIGARGELIDDWPVLGNAASEPQRSGLAVRLELGDLVLWTADVLVSRSRLATDRSWPTSVLSRLRPLQEPRDGVQPFIRKPLGPSGQDQSIGDGSRLAGVRGTWGFAGG